MNLREEIDSILMHRDKYRGSVNQQVDDILKLIEKRIDEICNGVMKDPPNPNDKPDFWYYRGMVATFAELKKEMLKK